jgi:hypothetical protein
VGLFRRKSERRGERDRDRGMDLGGDMGRPTTAMSSSTGSGVPPPFDAAELGAYARESREVSYQFPFLG